MVHVLFAGKIKQPVISKLVTTTFCKFAKLTFERLVCLFPLFLMIQVLGVGESALISEILVGFDASEIFTPVNGRVAEFETVPAVTVIVWGPISVIKSEPFQLSVAPPLVKTPLLELKVPAVTLA